MERREGIRQTGVYKIVCKKNGRVYIGSSTRCLARRRSAQFTSLRAGTNTSTALQDDFELYGESEFEFIVLHYLPPGECRKCEQDEIIAHDAMNPDRGYNQRPVGTPGVQPGNFSIHLRLSQDLFDAIQSAANETGRTIQSVIIEALSKSAGVTFVEPRRGWQGPQNQH